MTYFGFLLTFILLPLVILFAVTLLDGRRGKTNPGFMNGRAVWLAIGLQVILALVYTTPWDNYLVASGVWYYNPDLISGLILGWVPIEEYTFFILETIFVGLWWWFLARRINQPQKFSPGKLIRITSTAILGAVWLVAIYAIIAGWEPATYLSLILAWAIPAIMIQLIFGADILWHYRRLVILAILPIFLYISAADSLAIASGTWTIDPGQSLGLLIGPLPIEEVVFFLVTVLIVAFGLTLALAHASQSRWAGWVNRILRAKPSYHNLRVPSKE